MTRVSRDSLSQSSSINHFKLNKTTNYYIITFDWERIFTCAFKSLAKRIPRKQNNNLAAIVWSKEHRRKHHMLFHVVGQFLVNIFILYLHLYILDVPILYCIRTFEITKSTCNILYKKFTSFLKFFFSKKIFWIKIMTII